MNTNSVRKLDIGEYGIKNDNKPNKRNKRIHND